MNTQCPACGFIFEKESGYFLGAIVIAYFVGAFSVIPTLIIAVFVFKLEVPAAVALAVLQVLLMHPFLYRYSKLTWIYLENRMTGLLDKRR